MSTVSSTVRPPVTTAHRVGLVLCGLLGLLDVLSIVITPAPAPGEEGPPFVVLVAGTVLGVITLVGVGVAWVTRSRVAARVTAASRVVSVLLGLPAFFVEGVPAGLVAASAVITVVTAVAVYLLLRRPRSA
jgi:hypothetical protein